MSSCDSYLTKIVNTVIKFVHIFYIILSSVELSIYLLYWFIFRKCIIALLLRIGIEIKLMFPTHTAVIADIGNTTAYSLLLCIFVCFGDFCNNAVIIMMSCFLIWRLWLHEWCPVHSSNSTCFYSCLYKVINCTWFMCDPCHQFAIAS